MHRTFLSAGDEVRWQMCRGSFLDKPKWQALPECKTWKPLLYKQQLPQESIVVIIIFHLHIIFEEQEKVVLQHWKGWDNWDKNSQFQDLWWHYARFLKWTVSNAWTAMHADSQAINLYIHKSCEDITANVCKHAWCTGSWLSTFS